MHTRRRSVAADNPLPTTGAELSAFAHDFYNPGSFTVDTPETLVLLFLCFWKGEILQLGYVERR